MTDRRALLHDLRGWIDTMPDVAARLDAGALVLDPGCGEGWSSIGLALAFRRARVVGVDSDAPSIAQARSNAEAAGVSDRTWFVEADPSDESKLRSRLDEDYALVSVFPALLEMADPVRALDSFRGVLAPGGVVLFAAAVHPPTVAGWALDAGFTSTEQLPVTHDSWRFSRIT